MSARRRLALVTGAGGVLGAAIARRLAAHGHRVLMLDSAPERLRSAACSVGDAALPIVMDVSDAEVVRDTCTTMVQEHGDVDILVNNAGILSNHKTADTSAQEWRRLMAVNLDGPFHLCRALLPGMRERGFGRVVNVCSLAMKTGGLTAGTAYTASKGGLGALTFSLARAGITVNGVAPTFVHTEMIRQVMENPEFRNQLLKRIPLGRIADPKDVVGPVMFFCSEASAFVTGQIVYVDGGITASQ